LAKEVLSVTSKSFVDELTDFNPSYIIDTNAYILFWNVVKSVGFNKLLRIVDN